MTAPHDSAPDERFAAMPAHWFARFFRLVKTLFRWNQFDLALEPERDISANASGYLASGTRPGFLARSGSPRLPTGLCLIRYSGGTPQEPLSPWLVADDGGGWQGSTHALPASDGRPVERFVKLPATVRALRFMPGHPRGRFRIDRFDILETGPAGAIWHFIRTWLKAGAPTPARLLRGLRLGRALWREGGLAALKIRMLGLGRWSGDYAFWIERYERLDANDLRAIRRRVANLPLRPLISVVMPTYNTPANLLAKAIESVQAQLYPNWELCIADDASTQPHVRRFLENCQRDDPRIKLVFRTENGHISEASNSALNLATGDFIALLDHDDELPPHALYLVAEYLNRHPEADVLYSDEDKITLDGERYAPYFKPEFNEALLLSHNMVSHLGIYRRAKVLEAGGFRVGYEGSQDYDLLLRVLLKSSLDKIRHIPYVLYHWRAIPGSTAVGVHEKDYALDAALRATNDYLAQRDPGCRVVPGNRPGVHRLIPPRPERWPKASLIVSARENLMLLPACVESILERTRYPDYEILLAVPVDAETALAMPTDPRIEIVAGPPGANFAALNNHAANRAGGEILCFLHTDTEVISPDWLEEMAGHALRRTIGAVGAKLLYGDGSLQHAGLVLGIAGGVGTAFQGLPAEGHSCFARYYSAVSGACLAVRRELYEAVEGFDATHLGTRYHDVDFCLKLRERGYFNYWTPNATLYHYDMDAEDAEDETERGFFVGKWRDRLVDDPCYNPNLGLESANFRYARPRLDYPWKNSNESPRTT